MKTRNRFMRFVTVLSITALALSVIVSCGGGGGGGTSNNNNLSTTTQAANSSSSAMGAVKLSSTVGMSADMASGSVPAGYAPGKRKAMDTSDIAKLDPRLQQVVDKMMSELQKPAISNTMSKSRLKTMSAPLSAATMSTTCALGGSVIITADTVSGGTTTTNTLQVTFDRCREQNTTTYGELHGSLTGTHTLKSTVPTYEFADLTINLTDTEYPTSSFTANSEMNVYVMNGVFKNTNNNNTSGNSSALGVFSWTIKDAVNGDTVMSFQFGSGQTPVTDAWSDTNPLGYGTETHTGNGTYVLSVASPGGSLTYNVTLSALGYQLLTTSTYEEESINGSVNISWTPDLSQWGCANGTYTFTTAAPIHTPSASLTECPTSGILQVNNATIQFNSNESVEVTVGTLSETFPSCQDIGGGMCG